ncbi:hypothetical protein F2Q68_00021578 [Brassica cretica]|nr:hypothetical protein F2Q68_00021578 [Brassica cretica]
MYIGWLRAARRFLRVNHGFLLSPVTKELLAVRAAAILRTSMSSDVSAMFQIRWNFDFHRLQNALMLLRMVLNRFGLSIRKIMLTRLQHLVGIMVLSYEPVRDLLWGGPYFSGPFSPKRVCLAVAYNRYRLHPDLPAKEESETSMEECVPYDIQDERERSRSLRNKQIAVDDEYGAVDRLEYPTDELFRNFLNSKASGNGTDQADPPGVDNFAPDFDNFFLILGCPRQ